MENRLATMAQYSRTLTYDQCETHVQSTSQTSRFKYLRTAVQERFSPSRSARFSCSYRSGQAWRQANQRGIIAGVQVRGRWSDPRSWRWDGGEWADCEPVRNEDGRTERLMSEREGGERLHPFGLEIWAKSTIQGGYPEGGEGLGSTAVSCFESDPPAAGCVAWIAAEVPDVTCGTLGSGREWLHGLWLRVPRA